MIRLTNLDLPGLDLPGLDLPGLDLPGLDLSGLERLDPTRIDLTRFDVRNLDLPQFASVDLPEVPPVDLGRITGLARDAAYVGVGAAVVTARALDERRRELTDQVSTQVRKLVDAVV